VTGPQGQFALVCVAVDAYLLEAGDVATLREQADQAVAGGAAAVFVTEGSLGDPIVVAAGLAATVPGVRLGARLHFSGGGRHPAMLARELTSLDLVCGGRSVVCFTPPFTDTLAEAITLCRALWRDGEVAIDGPAFPVHAGRNRARPQGGADDSPLIALDFTGSGGDGAADEVAAGGETALVALADLVLRPTPDPAVCRLERV
jgi:alkanesulfonate monooxygenase SsuD/methylene tetrahydromethanopterin reductase-like flavin-dependent oxidoreductase (luciferase family)